MNYYISLLLLLLLYTPCIENNRTNPGKITFGNLKDKLKRVLLG